MYRSRFRTFTPVQDHVSGVALRAKTEGESIWTTTVIPPWRDFEDWPYRFNAETGDPTLWLGSERSEEIVPEGRF